MAAKHRGTALVCTHCPGLRGTGTPSKSFPKTSPLKQKKIPLRLNEERNPDIFRFFASTWGPFQVQLHRVNTFLWGSLGEICNCPCTDRVPSPTAGHDSTPTGKEDTTDITIWVFSCIPNRGFLKPQPQEQLGCHSPSVSFHTSSRESSPCSISQ